MDTQVETDELTGLTDELKAQLESFQTLVDGLTDEQHKALDDVIGSVLWAALEQVANVPTRVLSGELDLGNDDENFRRGVIKGVGLSGLAVAELLKDYYPDLDLDQDLSKA